MKTASARIVALIALLLSGGALQAQWCVVPTPPATPPATPRCTGGPGGGGGSGAGKNCSMCTTSPCYAATGGYTTSTVDLQLPTPGFPLVVSRSYESAQVVDGLTGIGWTLNLSARLYYTTYLYSAPSTYAKEADVTMPNGQRYRFAENANGTFNPPYDRYDTLVRQGDGTYLLTTADGSSRYLFAATGELQSISDEWGNTLNLTYDGAGKLQRIADAAGSGRYLDVYYGANGRVSSIQDNSSREIQFAYATDGTLASVTDPIGRQTKYSYQNVRFGPVLTNIKDHWNRTITDVTYDALARVASYSEAAETFTYTYGYNGRADQTSKVDSDGKRWTATFESEGPISRRDLPGGNNTQTVYNADRSVQMTTDEAGVKTFYTYGSNGRLASVTRDYQGALSVRFDFTYDTAFPTKVTSVLPKNPSTGANNPDWQGWQYQYYQAGSPAPGALWKAYRLRSDGLTAALVVTYEYDSHGRMLSLTDATAGRTDYAYDNFGNLSTVTLPTNQAGGLRPVITYGYDTVGRVTSITDALGKVTSYTYDGVNRLTSFTLPKPTPASTLVFTTVHAYDIYDATSQLLGVTTTDPNGRVITQKYDAFGRLVIAADQAGNATTNTYTRSRLTKTTDANGYETAYTYGPTGRLATTTFPDGKIESYQYTPDGLLQSRTDRKNQTITYAYDALKRMVSKIYPGGASITWTHVGQKLAQVYDTYISPAETHAFTYDDQFRIVSNSQGSRGSITYTHDAADRILTRTVSGGPTATRSYFADGSVDAITWSPITGSTQFDYSLAGEIATITLPNAQKRVYAYDDQGRLTSTSNLDPTLNPVATYVYTYDQNWYGGAQTMIGQRTAVTTTMPALSLSSAQTKFYYDSRYQLAQADYPTGTPFNGEVHTWTYDAVGNRQSASTNGTAVNYTYQKYGANANNSGRLSSDGLDTYSYDNNGNVASRATTNIGWDHDDRVISVSGTTSSTYTYDYIGRRASKTVSGITTTYLYDDNDVIAEVTGGVTTYYLFGQAIDSPLATAQGTVVTYHLVDGQGSVVGTTDQAGVIKNTYAYDVWGATRHAAELVPQPFRYTARELGDSADFTYFRARILSSRVGRFLSEDPLAAYLNLTGGELYAYVFNSPLMFDDPTGLACRNGVQQGPWNVDKKTWEQDWYLKSTMNNTQAGTSNAPPKPNSLVPANQSPKGGVPWTLQECLWEKALKVTTYLSQRVTAYRACDCPDSYEVLFSYDDKRTDVWFMGSGQYQKTVGFMVAGAMKPCPKPRTPGT